MSISGGILEAACKAKPYQATLVPEKRMELTTEGGLDVLSNLKKIAAAIKKLEKCGIRVSLFIDPDKKQIDASKKAGARIIELHTGRYADAKNKKQEEKFFNQIKAATVYAFANGFTVNAGHGLDYDNARRIAKIEGIEELNIGYSIITRSLFTGIFNAVQEMKRLVE